AGRDLDVVERIEVVVIAGGADRARIADVDAVQVLRVLCARRAARAVGALESAGGSANVGPCDGQAGNLVFDERPDVAPARRALQQLFAQVHGDVRARGVDGRRLTGNRHRLGQRRDLQRLFDWHRLPDQDGDVGPHDGLEAGELQLHRIGPWHERR